MNSEYCLEIKETNKTFPGVKALDNANFKLKKGSIHALVGENGAEIGRASCRERV